MSFTAIGGFMPYHILLKQESVTSGEVIGSEGQKVYLNVGDGYMSAHMC